MTAKAKTTHKDEPKHTVKPMRDAEPRQTKQVQKPIPGPVSMRDHELGRHDPAILESFKPVVKEAVPEDLKSKAHQEELAHESAKHDEPMLQPDNLDHSPDRGPALGR